jgi:hypothetical protein
VENVVEQHITVRCMRIACWISTWLQTVTDLPLDVDEWLTVRRSITLSVPNLMHKIISLFVCNTFIKILYLFRAVRCSSSGGLIVSMQPLILSLSVGDCPVHRLRKNSFFLNRCTGQSPTDSDDIRCCIDTIRPPEDEQRTARNM